MERRQLASRGATGAAALSTFVSPSFKTETKKNVLDIFFKKKKKKFNFFFEKSPLGFKFPADDNDISVDQ